MQVNLAWLQRQDTAVAKAMPFADTIMEELDVDFEELDGRRPLTKPRFHRHITLPPECVPPADVEHVSGAKHLDDVAEKDTEINTKNRTSKSKAKATKTTRTRRNKKQSKESPVKTKNITEVIPSVLESESAVFCVDANIPVDKKETNAKLSASALNFPHIISLLNSSPAIKRDVVRDSEVQPRSPVHNETELQISALSSLSNSTVGASVSNLLSEDSTDAALLSNIPTLRGENSKLLNFNELSWLINTNSNESTKDSLSNVKPASESSRDSLFGENASIIRESFSQISKQSKTKKSVKSGDALFRSPPPVTRVAGPYGGMLPMAVKLKNSPEDSALPAGNRLPSCESYSLVNRASEYVSSGYEQAQQFVEPALQTLIDNPVRTQTSNLQTKFQNIAALLAPRIEQVDKPVECISGKSAANSCDLIPSVPTDTCAVEGLVPKVPAALKESVPSVYLRKGSTPTDVEALDLVLKELQESKMLSQTDSIIQLPETIENTYSSSEYNVGLTLDCKLQGLPKGHISPDANSSSMDSPLTGADVLMTSGVRVNDRIAPVSCGQLHNVTHPGQCSDTTSSLSIPGTANINDGTAQAKLLPVETSAVQFPDESLVEDDCSHPFQDDCNQPHPVTCQENESLSRPTVTQSHVELQTAHNTQSIPAASADTTSSHPVDLEGVISDMLLPDYLPQKSTETAKSNSSEWPLNGTTVSENTTALESENRSAQVVTNIDCFPTQLSQPPQLLSLQSIPVPPPAPVPCQTALAPPGNLPPVKLLPSGVFQANPPVVMATQEAVQTQITVPPPIFTVPLVNMNSTQYVYFQNPSNPSTLIAVPVSLSGPTLWWGWLYGILIQCTLNVSRFCFSQELTKRHPIAHRWGWSMGWLL